MASAAVCVTSPRRPTRWAPCAARPPWPTSSTARPPRAACCPWPRSTPACTPTRRSPSSAQFAEKVLRRMGTEQLMLANFASEAVKASNANVLISTTATATEGGWLLNGEKSFGCLSGTADYYLVTARREDVPGIDGLGLFLVARDSAGVRPPRAVAGPRHARLGQPRPGPGGLLRPRRRGAGDPRRLHPRDADVARLVGRQPDRDRGDLRRHRPGRVGVRAGSHHGGQVRRHRQADRVQPDAPGADRQRRDGAGRGAPVAASPDRPRGQRAADPAQGRGRRQLEARQGRDLRARLRRGDRCAEDVRHLGRPDGQRDRPFGARHLDGPGPGVPRRARQARPGQDDRGAGGLGRPDHPRRDGGQLRPRRPKQLPDDARRSARTRRPDLPAVEQLVDGVWSTPADTLDLVLEDPFTGEPIGAAPASNEDSVEAALAAADRVHATGAWSSVPVERRAEILDAVGAALQARAAAAGGARVVRDRCAGHADQHRRRDRPRRLPPRRPDAARRGPARDEHRRARQPPSRCTVCRSARR